MRGSYYNEIDPFAAEMLRAYGNSINTAQAEGFIRAVMG